MSRQSQPGAGSNPHAVSTRRFPVRRRAPKPVVPLPRDSGLGYPKGSETTRIRNPPIRVRQIYYSKSSNAGFQGRRTRPWPPPESRPPSKRPTHRHDRTPEAIKHTPDTRRKQALSLRAQSFQQTSSVGQLGPPLELGSPRGRIQSNSNDADSA